MTQPLFPSQEGLEWLRVAARDIRLAELALGDSPPLAGEALYHAQQAAEKVAGTGSARLRGSEAEDAARCREFRSVG